MGPAHFRGCKSIKHLMETVRLFKCHMGDANIFLLRLESNNPHLQATDTFWVAQLAIPKHLLISEEQDGFAERWVLLGAMAASPSQL